jgi:hypothetical protein
MKNLSVLKVNDLKVVLNKLGFTGVSAMKRAELIAQIETMVKGLDVLGYGNDKMDYAYVAFGTDMNVVAPARTNSTDKFICPAHRYMLSNGEVEVANTVTFFNVKDNANVFVVDCVEDFELLHAITGSEFKAEMIGDIFMTEELNREACAKLFDMVVFSANAVAELSKVNAIHNLHGVAHEFVMLFNKKVIADSMTIDITAENDRLLVGIEANKEANKADRKVKPQYKVRKVSIDDLVWEPIMKKYVLPKATNMEARTVSMSENRLFRTFHNEVNEEVDGVVITSKHANDFFIFSAVSNDREMDNETLEVKVKAILSAGFVDLTQDVVTGEPAMKHHLVCLQSASQARVGKFYFTSLDRDMVRDTMCYGHDFGTVIEMSKVEARLALGTSSANVVGTDFSFEVIADKEYMANRVVVEFDGNKLVKVKKDISLTPTDGQGTIEVIPSARIANRLGLISARELAYFVKNYTNLDDIKAGVDAKLTKIFNKIPNAFQIRHAGDKGLLVMWNHSKYGYTQDIVMCESMHKYTVSENPERCTLEICNYNKAKEDTVYMSYQFIQALDIKAEDLIALTDRALAKIDKEIMTDSNKAMKFLGMVYGVGSNSTDEDEVLVSKITKILAEDPTMLNDKKVQTGLKKLLVKFINDLSIGRVPVKGSYAYICCDPRFMHGEDTSACLQSGQNWFNNEEGLFAGFRSPLMHSSEIARLNMVKDDALWFMKDIIVLNPFDDTLPRMGGADCDGDSILITNEELVIKSLPAEMPMLYDAGKKGKKVEDNWSNRIQHFFNTAKVSRIGQITNIAAVYRDLSLHNNNSAMYDMYVMACRFYQGWEIDKAKTGFDFELPKSLLTKAIPHWLVAVKGIKGRSLSAKAQVYTSNSPLGKLYDYVTKWNESFNITIQTEDKTLKFLANVNASEVERIAPIVAEYERAYCKDMASLLGSNMDEEQKKALAKANVVVKDLSEKEIEDERQAIVEKYTHLLACLSDDETAVACAAYNAAYNKANSKSKSYSFPWLCTFNGMLQLLHLNNNATKLVKLPNIDETPEEVVVSNDGMLFINGVATKMVDFEPGVYEVVSIDGSHYIKVKRADVIQEETKTPERLLDKKLYQFAINGFKHLGLNAIQVLDLIKANNNEFAVVNVSDRAMIAVGDRLVAYFNKTSNSILSSVINTKFSLFENEEVIYVPKAANKAKATMIDEVYAVKNSFNLTAMPVSILTADEVSALQPKEDNTTFTCTEVSDEAYDEGMYVYTSEASVVLVEDQQPAVEIKEETLSIIEVSDNAQEVKIVTEDEKVDENVLSSINTELYFWDVKNINKPANVEGYTVAITNYDNRNIKPNTQIGIVTAYKNGVAYNYEVFINAQGNALEIRSFHSATAEFCKWAYRIVSYKSAEMRLANK